MARKREIYIVIKITLPWRMMDPDWSTEVFLEKNTHQPPSGLVPCLHPAPSPSQWKEPALAWTWWVNQWYDSRFATMFKPLLMDRPLIFSPDRSSSVYSMYSVCTYIVLWFPDKRDDCTRVGGWLAIAKYQEVTPYFVHLCKFTEQHGDQ